MTLSILPQGSASSILTLADGLAVVQRGNVRSVTVIEDFLRGQVVRRFQHFKTSTSPTLRTIQVSDDLHVDDAVGRYVNHSCDPTVYVDTQSLGLIALRHIRKGEEITFFYPATEWDMAEPFQCNCGHESCLGEIRGAQALPLSLLDRYAVAPHIRCRLLA